MTKIDIFSGFLGAGKTTLIKKLLAEAYQGEKLVLIENEFGEISVDGGFLRETGVEISEMSSGCICCSLVGDFGDALKKVLAQFHPDRILIEPSGVGKLSDVIVAVQNVADQEPELRLNSFVTVVDASKVKGYMKNFGEFYNNQVESAGTLILSRTQNLSQDRLEAMVDLLREKNPRAAIITTPWSDLDGKTILTAMEQPSLEEEMLSRMRAEHEAHEAEHHHHHHGHDGHDGDEEQEHRRHHDHGGDEEHTHHHHDGEHDHGHHHHHDADEVFTSWGRETVKPFDRAELEKALSELDLGGCGAILRAKGIVRSAGGWLHFDYVPGEWSVREGPADYTGRLCVIGADLKEDRLAALFGL